MEQNSDNVKEIVKKQFGANAEKYVTSVSHAKADDLGMLVDWLQPKPHWTVLDVATGGGHTAKSLTPYAGCVVAADLTPEMLAAARKHIGTSHGKVLFVIADAEHLPFLNETFEAVTCRIAAHHFPEPALFVREAARVLKPGGKLLLIDNVVPEDPRLDAFVNTLEKLRDESHVRCCSIAEWEAWLQAAGLLKCKERLRKKMLDFPVWVRRTAVSEDQVSRVETHLTQADAELRAYCGEVLGEDGRIAAIHIDEWMTLWEKPEGQA